MKMEPRVYERRDTLKEILAWVVQDSTIRCLGDLEKRMKERIAELEKVLEIIPPLVISKKSKR